jgi:tetratricopeptide (TPR) repeat protein
MKEQIRSLINTLEQDPNNEQAIDGLEELVTGDEADANTELIAEELDEGRQKLAKAGRFKAACKIVNFALALANDSSREAVLLTEKARILDDELFDQKAGLEAYKSALSLAPDDEDLKMKVESTESERENWQQIVEKFVSQAEDETETSLKSHMLYTAAERTYKNHKRGKDIPSLLYDVLKIDSNHLKAARLLEKVLRERDRFEELAELYASLAEYRRSKEERAQMLSAAARTYSVRLEDNESAAIHYSEVLDLLPGNQTALKFLVNFYEEQEDWDHLAAIYEDALEGRLSSDEEMAMLMQAGMIHWRMRAKPEVAEKYFRRLRKLTPSHAGMINFYRTYLTETDQKAKLLQVLNDAQRATTDKDFGDKLNKEIAQLAAAEGGNTERAIDAFKAVLRQEPENVEALDELKRLYRDTEKWNALLDLFKSEAEALPDEEVDAKTGIYESIIEIYRDNLSLGTMVINTYKTILSINPGNENAQTALLETYENEGRWNDLINLLGKRVETVEDPAEKIEYLNRMASLWIERFNNAKRAIEPLEQILEIDATNADAISALRKVYEKRRAWRDLLNLMEKEVSFLEGDEKVERLQEMASLASDRLSDHGQAIQLWNQVLELNPESIDAPTALEKLTERSKDWEGLCNVLDIRVSRSEDDNEIVTLLTKLGTVAKDRLKDPARAAGAWKKLLQIKPGHKKSIRSLREAYLAAEDWEALEQLYAEADDFDGLVEQLGIAADRVSDLETKKKLSFRCAEIYNDPIGQPDRAVRHYERVVAVEPDNERAARELAPIYRRGEKWNRLLGVLESVLNYTTDTDERVLLMEELREIAAVRMNNRAQAYDWAAKSFVELPHDEGVRETLETAAEAGGKFLELTELYKEQLDKFEGEDRVAMERHIAELSLERLGATDDAVTAYRAILEANPEDSDALTALENIFRNTAQWKELTGIFDKRIALCDDDDKLRKLMIEVAQLLEDGMDDLEEAELRYMAVLEKFPADEDALVALDRIARISENWSDLVSILSQRRELDSIEEEEWRDISAQLAALYDEQLEDREQSIAVYNQLFEKYPGDTTTIEAMEHFLRDEDNRTQVATILEPHLITAENWRLLAWALAILIEGNAEPFERLELQNRLADVYGEKLDDGRLAFDTLGVALKESPDNRNLWDRMNTMSGELGLQSDLADHYAEAYQKESLDDGAQIELARRLSDLLDHQLGRPDDATVYHARVFADDPGNSEAFGALEGMYTANEQWDDLLELYKNALEAESEVASTLDLQLKICFIYEEVQQNVPEAIKCYRTVLEMDPGNQQGIRALTALYEESESWDDLSLLLQEQLLEMEGEEAVGMRYRLGEISEQYLDDSGDALEYYEQVLDDDPDHLRAQEALERLIKIDSLRIKAARVLEQNYDLQGAADPLARVLLIELEDEDLDSAQRVEILSRVADLRERRLSDAVGAFEVLSQAFALEPANDSVRSELARLASENGMSDRYAGVLDNAINSVMDDTLLAGNLISEVARIYDNELGDLTKAEEAYRKLLDLDSDNPDTALPAVEALERILTGGEAWEQLLEVLRIKARLTDEVTARNEILHRMAEIEESVVDRPANAISLFVEILDYDDTDTNALFGLERLYEREAKWNELIEILRTRAVLEQSADMRRDLYFRVASLFEEKLEDHEEAIAAYNQVSAEVGPDREALSALARLYQQTERWRDLLEVYETEEQLIDSEEERAELFFKMGDLLYKRLDEPEDAVQKLGSALEINQSHGEARAVLESLLDSSVRGEAIRLLKPIYEVEANYEQLIKCDEIEAADADDPLDKSAVLRHAAEVAEVGLTDADRAFSFMGNAFVNGVASPDLNRIIDDLERLSQQVSGHEKLVELYRNNGPDIMDGDLQVRCNLRVAEIAHTLMDDDALAREFYVRVLDMDGENEAAMDALEQIYESSEQYMELFEIYRRKVQNAYDDDVRTQILFKQARVCEVHLEDISGATTTYETILESDLENSDAMEALERLYPKSERWADLMDLLERRADVETNERADLLHRLGSLAEDKLSDDERALDYYAKVLEIDLTHGDTLAALELAMEDDARRGRVAEILEPVFKGTGDWKKLAESLEAQFEFCDDPDQRKDFIKQIGTLYEEQLGDLDKAFETFARWFADDPEDKSAWDILTRLTSVTDGWERLAEVYAVALEDVVGDTPTTAELSFVLGDLYEARLDQPEKATKAYRRTLSFAPDDPKAFSAVERMLLATENWNELLELYRDAADASLETDMRKEYIFKIAEIHEGPNSDLDAAIDAYRDIFDFDDRDPQAISSLDRLYRQTERFEDLAEHIRVQIDQSDEPQVRNDLRCNLGRVYEENLEDTTSAVDMYEEALHEEGGGMIEPMNALEKLILKSEQRRRIAEILEPVYREVDEWKKLVVILQAQVEYLDAPAEKAAMWAEIAVLHETRGNNFTLAFKALASAFTAEPSERDVLNKLVKLAEGIEAWDELVTVFNETLEDIYDLDLKKEVLQTLGSTYDRQLDMPRKAIDAYKQVLEIDETDDDGLNALEGLYNLVGDWDGLVEILAAKANFAGDPHDQAELLRTKASIHEDLMSSTEDAIDSYRQALDADPSSPLTMDALERLYEGAKEWNELIEIKRQRVNVVTDDQEQLVILKETAEIYEQRLDDAFDAVSAWQNVLERDDRDTDAIAALDRLYTQEEMHVELLDNLNVQKEITSDQAAWIDISTRIGKLQEDELSDLEGAIESYRDILAQLPTHAGTIEALTRLAKDEGVRQHAIEVLEPLHREAGRWDALVEIEELKLELIDDETERLTVLLGLAELQESGRSDPGAAFDVYARALAADPSQTSVMESLERIAGIENLWSKLNDVLNQQAEKVYDAEIEWALLIRLGGLREARLSDNAGAIEAYRRALDGGSMDKQVLCALDRLYERSSSWTELDEILEREIEVSESDDDINRFKLRQGAIRDREFGDVSGAITAFRDVISSSPDSVEAINALEALMTRDDHVEEIVEILTPVYELRDEKEKISELFEHRLRVADNDTEKCQLYRDLALHQEGVIGDLSATFDAYTRAFTLDPADVGLLDDLERLAGELGAWVALVDSVEQITLSDALESSAAVELGLRVAQWAATNVGDPRKAESLYRSVLDKEPEHQESLKALVDLLRNLGRFEELLPVMHQRAEATYDFEEKKKQLMDLAQIARFELGNAQKAMEAYRAVRELDEADIDALDALISLTEETNDFETLVKLLAARADYTPDLVEANKFRHRAATIYVGPLENPELAVDFYTQIFENDQMDTDAAVQLETLYQQLERWDDLKDLKLRQLDSVAGDEERVEILKQLATLSAKRFDDPDDAIGYLSEVLMVSPGEDAVVNQLKDLYTKTERWNDLVELLENQTDLARDSGAADDELRLLVEIGEIWVEHLDDPDQATSIYERVLERDPEHTRALASLAGLYESAQDWDRCAEVLNKAAATGRGGPDEAIVHYRLARLYFGHLADETKAVEELRRSVELDPSHREANQALAEHCRKVDDHNGLLEALMREEMHLDDETEKVAKLLEISDLQSTHLQDSAGAVHSLEQAKELVPNNTDVLLKLSDAYVEAGRGDDAIPVIEALIDAETDGGKKRSKKAAVYHQRLAKAYLARDDREKGLEHLEAAYKLDISNIEVLISLGKLHYESEDYDKAVKLFRALLLQRFDPSVGASKADIYWYVGDISLKQGDKRKAKGMFQRGLDDDKGHEGCKTGLAECS